MNARDGWKRVKSMRFDREHDCADCIGLRYDWPCRICQNKSHFTKRPEPYIPMSIYYPEPKPTFWQRLFRSKK